MSLCLNPCSNGILKYILWKSLIVLAKSLNPCSNGILKYVTSNASAQGVFECLNPCSNGILKYRCDDGRLMSINLS